MSLFHKAPTDDEIKIFRHYCYAGCEVWYDSEGHELPVGEMSLRGGGYGSPLYYEAESKYADLIKRLVKSGTIRPTKRKIWGKQGYVFC